uniref:Uncharacterized protein n=1 Tax=Meloidogyne enterolobii TaxID=390850 RepID=A0A6V7TTX1_MELEN|nr:unnamed protein product [Meloidogyne enterolobii]
MLYNYKYTYFPETNFNQNCEFYFLTTNNAQQPQQIYYYIFNVFH